MTVIALSAPTSFYFLRAGQSLEMAKIEENVKQSSTSGLGLVTSSVEVPPAFIANIFKKCHSDR